MALIEKFHVVAAERAVAVGQLIKEGMIVSLNSSGEVVKQDVTNQVPYGIAGDTKETSSSMPGIDIAHGWQNRVSDYYDETKASGKMTVYHSGGEFATDMYAANVATAAVNAPLYSRDGVLETVATQGEYIVARLIQSAGMYPSGVPGIDINGDQALSSESSDKYIEIKLVI